MKPRQFIIDFVKGGSLGTGILPGVSMGTVGIIVDIYDKMIDNIDGLRRDFKRSLINLIPIFLGVVIFTVLFMILWDYVAVDYFPIAMICILAGFIIGGFPLMYREIKDFKLGIAGYLRIIISFLFAAGIGVAAFTICMLAHNNIIDSNFLDGMSVYVQDPFSYPWIYIVMFIMGLGSAVASIVPGVSGAMLMFITGLYTPILNLIIGKDSSLILHMNFDQLWWSGATGMLMLIIGIVIGFLLISSFMKKALANHRVATFQIVCGFVLGSIVSMFLNNDMADVYLEIEGFNWQFIVGPILLVLTAVGTYHMIKKYEKRKAANISTSSEKEDQTSINPQE